MRGRGPQFQSRGRSLRPRFFLAEGEVNPEREMRPGFWRPTPLSFLADALGVAFVEGFTPMYGLFAVIGETSAIFWLLIKGHKLTIR